jgi:succinylglutamate desuccinylase
MTYITESIPGVVGVLEGKVPGPQVVIVGGTHGDEPCGPQAIKKILPSLSLIRGSVTFVHGNPRALEKKVRFTEANLNRMFRHDSYLSEEKKKSYEYQRSRELWSLYLSADALLDIHSSESPESTPFAICTERSRAIAECMPFPIVSWGWDAIEPGGSDDFMDTHGKIGVGVECGYDNDPEASARAETAIYSFLSSMNLIDYQARPSTILAQRLIHVTYAHMPKTNFTRVREFADFESIRAGELIGMDGIKEERAPRDGCLVFVRNRKAPGQEAYIFAEEQSAIEEAR